jgi:Glycosyltransferase family 87
LFVTLIATYVSIGWNLRSRILEGNNDFVAFYTAARMAWDGKGAQLYDLRQQTAYQEEILRSLNTQFRFKDGLLAYNHPPFEVLWYIPLGGLRYVQAYSVWLAVSLGCVVGGVYLLLRFPCSLDRGRSGRYILGSLAFFPVFINFLQGQDSATLFLFWALSYWNLVRSREATAGVWLSFLLLKFQVLLPTLLVLLVLKRWRVLIGFLSGSLALLAVSLALVGPAGIESYGRLIVEMSGWIERRGVYPSQMHNLRAQFYVWLYGQHPVLANLLTGLASVALLALLVRAWRGEWEPGTAHFGLKFSLLVTISILVSPHLNLHDLSCLLLPGILIGQISDQDVATASSVRRLRRATWLFGFPLVLASLSVSGWLSIHLSVCGMVGIVFLLIQTLKQSGGGLKWETVPEVLSRES